VEKGARRGSDPSKAMKDLYKVVIYREGLWLVPIKPLIVNCISYMI